MSFIPAAARVAGPAIKAALQSPELKEAGVAAVKDVAGHGTKVLVQHGITVAAEEIKQAVSSLGSRLATPWGLNAKLSRGNGMPTEKPSIGPPAMQAPPSGSFSEAAPPDESADKRSALPQG